MNNLEQYNTAIVRNQSQFLKDVKKILETSRTHQEVINKIQAKMNVENPLLAALMELADYKLETLNCLSEVTECYLIECQGITKEKASQLQYIMSTLRDVITAI